MTQPPLIADVLAPEYRPGWEGRRKCGRGATPRIDYEWVAGRKNVTGHTRLRYRFRPLARHQVPHVDKRAPDPTETKLRWQVACNLLAEYFMLVGGFLHVRDAAVTTWSDALDIFGAQEVRWAIRAKAASLVSDDPHERRRKRKFAGAPEKFPERLMYWLAQSPAYQKYLDDQAAAQRLAERGVTAEQLAAQRVADDQARAAGDVAELSRRKAVRESAAIQAARERSDADEAAWEALGPDGQAAARAATRPQYDQLALVMGADDALHRSMALDWARSGRSPCRPSDD